ncbi:PI-PLC X domain-containing protein At5g67130-like isoform X3 [Arachis duranensis]|uniref:PI-PLC X domain-containing protein At5g67130-like isoform X3 n=1 Tax=Arachis duranensis TaxID=130453 RepID=A0A9C6WLY3_ARADU|nr:PI-PLC X domain-containing protein At5g67130-like isoform X3 [Arachis duranensis]
MGSLLFLLLVIFPLCNDAAADCSKGDCMLLHNCSSNDDCGAGLYCFSCTLGFSGSKCVRSSTTDQFKLINNSLPFNKYAYLTTHNAFAIDGEPSQTGVPRVTITNQEDSITHQLSNGVRGLMLDMYAFDGDVWLCHSSQGQCHDYTAFEPAIGTLKEIEAFLSANPSEIVTLILEDYVHTQNGLKKVFSDAGLMKFWFPVTNMPRNGGDWPLVSDMVAENQRLIVFTSVKSKEQSEGIAYQWNYMFGDLDLLSSADGDGGRKTDNSASLIDMLQTCHGAAGNRWANFVAVDYYKKSEGGGAFQAVDMLNGKLLCGCDNVDSCVAGTSSQACSPH